MATRATPPAKKAGPAKKAAAAKQASPVKKAAPAKKTVPPKTASRRSADHPPPVAGELGAPNGILSIRVDGKWIAVSTLIEGHNDAVLTMEVKLSSGDLQLQTTKLSDLAQALQKFLELRGTKSPTGTITCCHQPS
jgi:hypothetical protein